MNPLLALLLRPFPPPREARGGVSAAEREAPPPAGPRPGESPLATAPEGGPARARRPRPGGGLRLFPGLRGLTVSVEGTSLRVLSFRGSQVESWFSLPFNPRYLRNGFIADPHGLGQVLGSGLASHGLGKGRIGAALAGFQAVSRVLPLPPLVRGSVDAFLRREARRALAVTAESTRLYWQELPRRGMQRRFYVLAVPQEPMLALVETLILAGIRPHAVDLKPLALARAVARRDAIVAHGETTSADVVIIRDDVPVVMRSVLFSEDPLAPEYAKSRFSEELSRTLGFYRDSHRDEPLDPQTPLYLSGELAQEPGFADEVASLTGHPLPPLDPPLDYPPHFPVAEYMVNLGLALKKV